MSSALAIAGVTQLLRDLLNEGLIDADVSGTLGGNVNVRTRAPDITEKGKAETDSILNLFLHRVSPNTGLVNEVLPPGCQWRPHRQHAFGAGSALPHERAWRGRVAFGDPARARHANSARAPGYRASRNPRGTDSLPAIGGDLPPALQSLGQTRLADQMEQIRITPVDMGLEEQSRLWTACQASLRSSTAYLVTVVLIERRDPAVRPLPVLTLGPNNQGVRVEPSLIPPFPAITGITLPAGQPSARTRPSDHDSRPSSGRQSGDRAIYQRATYRAGRRRNFRSET